MSEDAEITGKVEPVRDSLPRPVWSVVIPCFNCAEYLVETLRSVLAQDPGPEKMEIIVVDDCSTKDDPGAVVEALGAGRVRFIRQSRNVGKVRNYETGLSASRGILIHQLHGDDVVMPGFYTAMEDAFGRFPGAGAFFCESQYMDSSGHVTGTTGRERESTGILENWLGRIVSAQRIQTPSMVVKREVYEHLGGFDRRLDCSEDWEMWVRISHRYPVGFCREALARYRTSPGNNTARSIVTGTRGRIQKLMFDIVDGYLPPSTVREVRAERGRNQALFFASHLPRVIADRGFAGWRALCREVLRFSRHPSILKRIASLTFRALKTTRS